MTHPDDRPAPIEDLLQSLRDVPAHTDEELDAGCAAVLADLQHVPPERARRLDEMTTGAELGSAAYALGLEYLDRGDLARAAQWLQRAVRYGVPAAEQELSDTQTMIDSVLPLRQTAARRLEADRGQGDRPVAAASPEGSPVLAKARADADQLLAGARRDAAAITARAQELRARITSEIEELHERARREAAATKAAGDRCDALLAAAEEQLAKAHARAKKLVSEANAEAGKVRIAAVKKAEGLLKEAEQRKSVLIKEAEELKAEAIREARRTVEEEKRELEILVRRREDINAEISRSQDALEALDSFEEQSLRQRPDGPGASPGNRGVPGATGANPAGRTR